MGRLKSFAESNENLCVWPNWKFPHTVTRMWACWVWKLSLMAVFGSCGDKPQLLELIPALPGGLNIIINWRRANSKFESLPTAACGGAPSWFIAVFNAASEFTEASATLSVARTHAHITLSLAGCQSKLLIIRKTQSERASQPTRSLSSLNDSYF